MCFLYRHFVKPFLWIPIIFISFLATTTFYIFSFYDDKPEPKNFGVVFGAAVWRDDIPSHALYDRVKTGIDLYHQGVIKKLIFSGGPSKYGAHETDVMEKIALKNHVPKKAILTDYEGHDTASTIENLDPKKTYLFISNDFHLARIAVIARKNDFLDFSWMPAVHHGGRYQEEWYYIIREIFGVWFYFLFG